MVVCRSNLDARMRWHFRLHHSLRCECVSVDTGSGEVGSGCFGRRWTTAPQHTKAKWFYCTISHAGLPQWINCRGANMKSMQRGNKNEFYYKKKSERMLVAVSFRCMCLLGNNRQLFIMPSFTIYQPKIQPHKTRLVTFQVKVHLHNAGIKQKQPHVYFSELHLFWFSEFVLC